MEATHVMEVAQLLLSLIHSWGIDLHLDKVCETQLGLLRPQVMDISFKGKKQPLFLYETILINKFYNRSIFFKAEISIIEILYNLGFYRISDSGVIRCFIERWLHVTAVTNMAK